MGKNFRLSSADAELVDIAIEFVRKSDHQIREWRFLGRLNMTIPLNLAGCAADQKRRHVQAGMIVAFAHAAPVQNEGMIQQRPVAVRRRLESLDEL